MDSCPDHGSGIIIIIACGSERPPCTSSSSTLSNIAESDPCSFTTGRIFFTSSKSGLPSSDSRAFIQLMFPRSVLISPLCAM